MHEPKAGLWSSTNVYKTLGKVSVCLAFQQSLNKEQLFVYFSHCDERI